MPPCFSLPVIRRYQMAGEADAKTLEQRLRLIEDRFEIYNLIASHPPSADTGASDYTASVWTEDGVFDRGAEFARPTGKRRSPGAHQTLSTTGRSSRGSRILPGCLMCGSPAIRPLRFLIGNSCAGPCRSDVRCPQPWFVTRLPRAPRFSQSLGVRPHRRRLENQEPQVASAGRHRTCPRYLERRAEVIKPPVWRHPL